MDLKGLIITDHAIEQFVKRWEKIYRCRPDMPGALDKVLRAAIRDKKMNLTSYVNRIHRHAEETDFYATKDGWRLIVALQDDGRRALVTVERISKRQNRT